MSAKIMRKVKKKEKKVKNIVIFTRVKVVSQCQKQEECPALCRPARPPAPVLAAVSQSRCDRQTERTCRPSSP